MEPQINVSPNSPGMTSTPSLMLEQLLTSKETGHLIGVILPAVRPGILTCLVEDVCRDDDEDDFLVVLSQNVLLPGRSEATTVYLKEISGVFSI